MKTVHELNKDELEELRSAWYYQHLDGDSLEKIGIDSEEDVPMEIVITHYEGTFFVEEDFFCNL